MAKRATHKPGHARSAEDGPQDAGAQTAAEAAKATSAPHPEGDGDQDNTTAAPTPGMTLPVGEEAQADPADGPRGQPEASSSLPPASQTPSSAHLDGVARDTSPATDDGGREENGDGAAVAAVVTAIAGRGEKIVPGYSGRKPIAPGAVVKVTGPKRGRRRIETDFGREPRYLSLDGLSPEELQALKDDPLLEVEILPPQ